MVFSLVNPVILNEHEEVLLGSVFNSPIVLRWYLDGLWVDTKFGSLSVREETPEAVEKARMDLLMFIAHHPSRYGRAN